MNPAEEAIRDAAALDLGRDNAESAPSAPRKPILAETEVARRMHLLAQLQTALVGLGVRCVLVRNRRLVLQYNRSPCEPSGLTEPQLYIFAAGDTDIATTDGSAYRLASGRTCPAGDPGAAATVIAPGHGIGWEPDGDSLR